MKLTSGYLKPAFAFVIGSLVSAQVAFAAPEEANSTSASGLHIIAWALITIYALSTIGLGWYFGRQQKSTKEYFVGSGKMSLSYTYHQK